MPAGKKGKKKKNCKTVNLMSFLADGSGAPTVPLKSSNWADDVEDEHEGFPSRPSKEPVVLPTAPRAARDPGIDEENIPANPPYVAYISNLPYEVDEDDLMNFFAEMKVSNVRLPKELNKTKGYGYVEFEDRQSLIDALAMTNTTIKRRPVRIEVSMVEERRGGRMGRDNRRDIYEDPERTSGDWRSGPREEATSSEGDSFRNRYDNRDRRDDREAPEYDNKPGAWRDRDSTDRGRSTFRDRGSFRDDDRDREWSRFGDRGGSRDRDGEKTSSFGPRRNFGDSDWGDREGSRRQGRSNIDTKLPAETRTRPKLQLQPRTKPVEAAVVTQEESSTESATAVAPTPAPAPAPASAVNIFGAAKPVDTAAKEREIEERLAKSYAESRSREEGDSEKRNAKEGVWVRRNGEGREEKERGRQTWRTEEDNGRRTEKLAPQSSSRSDSKGPPTSRSTLASSKPPRKTSESRGSTDREKKDRDKEKEEIDRMPKAKDDETPSFIVTNKYSILPDDVDPDNIDD